MKNTLMLLGLLFLATSVSFAQEDVKGSKDHPLFTRMPDHYIKTYEEKDFDAYKSFRDREGKWITVEGRYYRIHYMVKPGAKYPSNIATIRNHTNAIKKVGGEVVYESTAHAYMKLEKGGKRIWAHVHADGDDYTLVVVEEEAMQQVVEANADAWKNEIQQTGKAALYGIYFDTGKSDIKPESEPALKEIARLLNTNTALKLHVVGHTDNVGGLDYNLKLSKARADAVVNELVNKHKIASDRLRANGVGPLSPVSTNSTENGKAKNRRVELVEQ